MSCINLTDDSFQKEVLDATEPVLIDFWAPWCGPCRMLGTKLEAIADRYAGRVKIAKLNVDDCPELATEYEVMSVPTVLLFKNGFVVNKIVGMPRNIEAQLQEMLDDSI